jgi:aryl carrier-like protein
VCRVTDEEKERVLREIEEKLHGKKNLKAHGLDSI